MKAMVLSDYKRLEIVDVPVPKVGPREVLVEVQACGICGSDVHGWDGSSGRRIPPLVMGHEAAGVVAQVGEQVQRFVPGDRVTFDSTVSCGECDFCRRGQINLCDHRQVLGVSCEEFRRDGAFAQYVVVPEHIVYKLPDELPFEHAALIEAVSVAVHAANRTPVRLGDTAVVVGTGMIGLLCIQTLRLAGCATVIAVDLAEHKLQTARELGADYTFNPQQDDVSARVKELTGGHGADVSMEVVGASPTIGLAIECTRKGGAVTLVGNLAAQVELPLQAVVTRELSLLGSCASNGEYPQCIEYLRRGDIKVDPLITAVAPLEEGPSWFDRLYAGQEQAMKVILKPNAG